MGAVFWFFGREPRTGYDREYEQEPPTDTAPALVPTLLRQGGEVIGTAPYTLVVEEATVPAPIPLAINNYFNLSNAHLEQFYSTSRYSTPSFSSPSRTRTRGT